MDGFYDVIAWNGSDTRLSCVIRFNADHAIFKGHFPSVPVVPGVCMVRAVHELMEEKEGVRLRLASADSLKFLSVIDPREVPQVAVDIDYVQEDNGYRVQACFLSSGVIYFKLKGTFRAI